MGSINTFGHNITAFDLARLAGMPRGLHFEGAGDGNTGDNNAGDGNTGDNNTGDGNNNSPDDKTGEGDTPKPGYVKKTQYDGVLNELKTERDARKALDKRIAAIEKSKPSDTELEEFRNFRVAQAKAEEERKKKEGQFDKILEETRKKYEDQLTAAISEKDKAISMFQEAQIMNALGTYIPQHTTVPISDIVPLMRSKIAVDSETNALVVLDDGGQPAMNDQGKTMTVEEFVAKWISARPHFATHKPKGGAGSGSGRGSGAANGQLTAEQIQGMSHSEVMASMGRIFDQTARK